MVTQKPPAFEFPRAHVWKGGGLTGFFRLSLIFCLLVFSRGINQRRRRQYNHNNSSNDMGGGLVSREQEERVKVEETSTTTTTETDTIMETNDVTN